MNDAVCQCFGDAVALCVWSEAPTLLSLKLTLTVMRTHDKPTEPSRAYV